MTISSSSIKTPRIKVMFMYVQKLIASKKVYDIGVLDEKYNFYEEHLELKVDAITPSCYYSLNKLFRKYLITKDTEIDLLDTIQKSEVIYMYLSIRNQSVFANMRFLNLDMIPRRIATYHSYSLGRPKKPSQITRHFIESLWKKLIELEKCPWINNEIDQILSNKSFYMRRRLLILRLAMYYMVVKRFLVIKTITSRENNKNKSQNSMIS